MKSQKGGVKILISILVLAILVAGGLYVYKLYMDKTKQANNNTINLGTEVVPEPEVQTFKGTDRPIAVMIDNHPGARPQANLNSAYMVYEIIVEGGYTRLMPVFKGVDLDKIGPIRSSRHYFLDYALENDAIYVHFGWSPQAQKDIKTLNVDNINGLVQSSTNFWRVKDKSSPHDVVTTTAKILSIAEKYKYATTSEKKSVLNYNAREVNLDSELKATDVTIPYDSSNIVNYKYDEKTKMYTRYSKGELQTEWDSKEPVTTKNIIITFAKNTTLNDGENKGRQTISNIGNLDGYYITNGKAIKITCTKSARAEQTVYKDLQGNEIKVNDGRTWVQICPLAAKVTLISDEEAAQMAANSVNTTTNQLPDAD